MSKVKGGGSTKNINDSPGQRLGVKAYGGQKVTTGSVLVRQRGSNKVGGPGTMTGRDYTIFASQDGIVQFRKTKRTRFTGKSTPRTEVSVLAPEKAS